jgi:DNA topoisomerase-2
MSEEYSELAPKEHIKQRPNMYVGSVDINKTELFILDGGNFTPKKMEFSPALLKCVDEIVVNAIDHYVRNPKKVKAIKITFDGNKISVFNDGPGIPIKKVETLRDGTKYQPEAIFTQLLSGSNFTDEKRITGGMNGLGAKLTNIFSSEFRVETANKGKRFTQTCKNRMETIEEAKIEKYDGEDYTLIEFVPEYKALGYSNINKDVEKIIESRAHQAGAFVDCEVYYNGSLVSSSFVDFVGRFVSSETYHTILVNPANKKLNMEICISVSDGKFRQVSLINGIYVYLGGTHIKHIQNEIVENLKSKVEKELTKSKKFEPSMITNSLFLFVKGFVENPEFNSQSKERLSTPIKNFENYKFKAKEWVQIWNMLQVPILENIIGKIKDKKQTKVNRGKIILEKGEDAKYAGHDKKYIDCTLMICEGDSALGLVESGINHKKTELERDYYGTFSIQGVPINVRKETKEMGANSIKIRNEKLKNNIRLNELVKILGLDYEKKYDRNTEQGKREFKTLRYGRVVIAVDQDEDGKGQIFGLLINFFMYFWPALADWGFVKRLNTPIIRAYPKSGKVVNEFYSLAEFRRWEQITDTKKYEIKYFKGLASHDLPEIQPIFSNFNKKLYTYDFDERAEEKLEIYYGKETNNRKRVLSTPVDEEDEIKDIDHFPISESMDRDVKEFQRDNILRKLPNVMDGLVPARRKVLFTAREEFKKNSNKPIKVCNFTGLVIGRTNYHHGDASMSKTIIKMAQSFVGAKNLPVLIGVGQLGSRKSGGEDHGSPRYVSVKLNKELTDIMYPRADDVLLEYHFDDGIRCEPKYYVPIIPMCVLESVKIPATGWSAELWGQDYKHVIKNVRSMIEGAPKCKSLGLWMRGNKSDLRYGDDGNVYMVGKYKYCDKTNTIKITELPLGLYNKSYIKNRALKTDEIKKTTVLRPEFKNYTDRSNYDEENNVDEIDIEFELSSPISEFVEMDEGNIISPIERFMGLGIKINSNINVLMKNGEVREFKYYSSLVNEWFPERKILYGKRLERSRILLELTIKYYENIIRFAEQRTKYGITSKTTEAEFNKILNDNKYDKFDKGLLFAPKFTATEKLQEFILEREASYSFIVNLSYRELLKEECLKRKDTLEKKKEELKEILTDFGDFTGKKTWLRELAELEKIIEKGTSVNWAEPKKYTFRSG